MCPTLPHQPVAPLQPDRSCTVSDLAQLLLQQEGPTRHRHARTSDLALPFCRQQHTGTEDPALHRPGGTGFRAREPEWTVRHGQ